MNGGSGTGKPCGLISLLPSSLHSSWASNLNTLIAPFRPAALVLMPPFDQAASIIEAAASLDLAVLLFGDIDQAKSLNASGVYLTDDTKQINRARAMLGTGAIIGAACDLTRHDAMEKAEAGADFVAFQVQQQSDLEEACELAAWWDEVIEVAAALACDPAWLDRGIVEHAPVDFLLIAEKERAGSSLTFATELGLVSQT